MVRFEGLEVGYKYLRRGGKNRVRKVGRRGWKLGVEWKNEYDARFYG